MPKSDKKDKPEINKEGLDLLKMFYKVDDSILLTEEETETIEVFIDEILLPKFEKGGLNAEVEIKEEINNYVIEENLDNIKKFLNIKLNENKFRKYEQSITKENTKIRSKDSKESFFDKALIDDTLNDIEYSLKGYERTVSSGVETFQKKRGALLPTETISVIINAISTQFNRTNFLSKKEDNEQSAILNFTFDKIIDIILSLPYLVCDEMTTKEIMAIIAPKLLNMIGLNNDFRTDIFTSLSETYNVKDDLLDTRSKKKEDEST